MIEGAIREDDFTFSLPGWAAGCPEPVNPYSPITRPMNHFFDAQRGGQGFHYLGVTGYPAPDWALGLQGRGSLIDDSHNHYTIPDARKYQLMALTNQNKTNREVYTASLFRSLGQVLHLVQDMAQPQHTRNDRHAGCNNTNVMAGEASWLESYIDARAKGIAFQGVPSSGLTLTGYGVPGISQYKDLWTTGAGQTGLADFSSLNFFSAGTNLPTNCGSFPSPACQPQAYFTIDRDIPYVDLNGSPVTGKVKLFLGTVHDFRTGQDIPNVPLSSRSVLDAALQNMNGQSVPLFSLNRLNYDAMADILLPRAVGYSTALLDYFFRGRLEADLVVDPSDASRYQMTATNASGEPLEGGTVTVYADDPDTGARSEVAGARQIAVNGIEKGQPLFDPLSFQPPPNAERFTVVYQGALGQEVPDLARDFPGAVIGKVIGGMRVEEITGNQIRTPDRTYTLPVPWWATARWGERDNTFVVRLNDQFQVYEINRPVGSADIPLVTQPDGTEVVDVKLLREVVFPRGMALGTTVEYTETVEYKQYVLTYTDTTGVDVTCTDPEQLWTCTSVQHPTVTTADARLLVSETRTLPHSFSLALGETFTSTAPYGWGIQDFTVTADGQVLALVGVGTPDNYSGGYYLSQPDDYTYPVYTLDANPERTGTEPSYLWSTRREPSGAARFQVWAVINVNTGRVVASTAPDRIVQAETRRVTHLWPPRPVGIVGDFYSPKGVQISIWNCHGPTEVCGRGVSVSAGEFRIPFESPDEVCPNEDLGDAVRGAVTDDSESLFTTQPILRPELQDLSFSRAPLPVIATPGIFVLRCHIGSGFKPVVFDVTASYQDPSEADLNRSPTQLDASLAGPGVGAGQIVFLARQLQPYLGPNCGPILTMAVGDDQPPLAFETSGPYCGGYLAKLATWTVNQGNAVVRQEFLPGDHRLVTASSGAALVTSMLTGFYNFSNSTTLVALRDGLPTVMFPDAQLTGFVPVGPGFFYNTGDGHFYRWASPLQQAAFPRSLPPGFFSGSSFQYHAVRLK